MDYALITGASSGIGECFARALAQRRQDLVLVARSLNKLNKLAEELRAAHEIRAEVIDHDLSPPGAAAGLTAKLRERALPISLLINNAGFGARGEFWKLDGDRQSAMVRLNVLALQELTHHLLPTMIEARRGAIINVSSTASFQPIPYTAVYAATKAFVTWFSMALEEELRPYSIKVVTLCPGGTQTNFFSSGEYGQVNFLGGLQTPAKVVEEALKALDARGGVVVPRLLNRLSIFAQRLAPRTLVVKTAARMFRPPPG